MSILMVLLGFYALFAGHWIIGALLVWLALVIRT